MLEVNGRTIILDLSMSQEEWNFLRDLLRYKKVSWSINCSKVVNVDGRELMAATEKFDVEVFRDMRLKKVTEKRENEFRELHTFIQSLYLSVFANYYPFREGGSSLICNITIKD